MTPSMISRLSNEALKSIGDHACFDGTRGAGRVYGDGSVIGFIQFQGSGSVRSAWLPPGTLKVKGETVCASLNSIPIEPCFDLSRTDDQSFRGSVLGLDSAYCNFTQRLSITDRKLRQQPSEPLSLNAARDGRSH